MIRAFFAGNMRPPQNINRLCRMPKSSRHTRRRASHRRRASRRHRPHRGGLLTPEQRNESLIIARYAVKDPRGYARSLFNEFQGLSINEKKAKKTFTHLYKRLHEEHARIVEELDAIIAEHPYDAARHSRALLQQLEVTRAAASRNYDGMIHAIPFNKSSEYFREMTENRKQLKELLDQIDASLAKYAPIIAEYYIQRGNMGSKLMSGNMNLAGVSPSSSNVPVMVSPNVNLRANVMSGNIELQ